MSDDFSWTIRSLGNVIKLSTTDFSPKITCVNSFVNLMKFITSCHFCCGNEDKKYDLIQAERNGVFKDVTGMMFIVYIFIVLSVMVYMSLISGGSTIVAVYVNDYFPYYTIRCTSCLILLSSSVKRCRECTDYRKKFNVMCNRSINKSDGFLRRTDPNSHTNYRWLRAPEGSEPSDV